MRLIDADKLIKTYEKETGYTWNAKGILECPKCFIDDAPTVEPKKEIVPVCKVTFDKEQLQEIIDKAKAEVLASVERPQGKWIMITEYDGFIHAKCSVCNQFNDWGDVAFCPWCGAKMQKGGKEQ